LGSHEIRGCGAEPYVDLNGETLSCRPEGVGTAIGLPLRW